MATVKPDGHIWSLKFNWYVCFSFHEILLRYSKFHIWLWKLKVKVTTKIDQNLVSWFLARCQQSCQKWKKSKKSLKSYHMNKTLLPAVYEPVQNIVTPGILNDWKGTNYTYSVVICKFCMLITVDDFQCWRISRTCQAQFTDNFSSQFKCDGNFVSLSCKFYSTNHYNSLNMTRQLCCRDMCRNLWWYIEMNFPSNLNCDGKCSKWCCAVSVLKNDKKMLSFPVL